MVKQARAALEKLADVPGNDKMMQKVENCTLPGCFEGLYQFLPFTRHINPLGAHEGVSLKLKLVKLDEDESGEVNEKELEEHEAQVTGMLDSAKEFLLTAGVVAALVLSMLYPLALEEQTVSDDATDFFGEDGVDVLKKVHDVLIMLGIMASVLSVFIPVRNYVQLIFWMPSVKDQVLFVQATGGQAVIACLMVSLMWVLLFTLATGASLARGPFAGLVVVIVGSLGGIYFLRYDAMTTAWCGALLHLRAKELTGRKPTPVKSVAGGTRRVEPASTVHGKQQLLSTGDGSPAA